VIITALITSETFALIMTSNSPSKIKMEAFAFENVINIYSFQFLCKYRVNCKTKIILFILKGKMTLTIIVQLDIHSKNELKTSISSFES
jgi:hypothetical protein